MDIRQGIDITNVRRMREAIERRGERFIQRIFTADERAYCESKRMKYEHYAARFAAKEALMKAVEVKRKDRYRFREIEVRRYPTGKPFIFLKDIMYQRFQLPRNAQIELSMAHERDQAIAVVLIVMP
ncbi:MAG: holo-ACP synthase [Candidatus Omnitrophica bacterium]|nr:holo-ACP synthase [Candidatus Omnitrophota bacterium]MDD5671210.1 holo-ACP synthase [Candidatus Omnitrophota bacterium]